MWYNKIITWLLKSPLHPLIDNNLILLTYNGRKSGRQYTLPVNYFRDGDDLHVISFRTRTWWRNLRSGKVPVKVRLKGKTNRAIASVVENDPEVADKLTTLLNIAPQYARYIDVPLDENRIPDSEAVLEAAKSRVVVTIKLK